MKVLQEKLDFLLDKYSVGRKVVLKSTQSAEIDGVEVPLFSHRSIRRFIELKNMVSGGTLFGVSVMRTARIVEKDEDLYSVLEREFDLCEYILGDSIKSVMAVKNENTINVIAETEKGYFCTIETAATLKKGQTPIDKHEIISQRGIACDIVVDAQLRQNSVYVISDEDTSAYTDVDFELYGLDEENTAVVRQAFAIAKKDDAASEINAKKHLLCLVEMAKKSVVTGEREVVAQ